MHIKAKDLYHILNEEFDSLSSQDFEKFKAIQPKKVQLLKLVKEFDELFKQNISKSDIIELIRKYLPDFSHIETGRNLDQKM